MTPRVNLRITDEQAASIARRKRTGETLSDYVRRLIDWDAAVIELVGGQVVVSTEVRYDGQALRVFIDGKEWRPKGEMEP